MPIGKQKLLDLYTTMLRIRLFEDRIIYLYARGDVPGLAHLYVGEEGVAAGVCAALNDDDFITSTHRGHGHVIAKGADVKYMMAELLGKKTGYCKGKGGSMHIADMTLGILGANGIVGGGLPIAAGAGLSAINRGTTQVCAAFFGDGATNTGSWHESLNLASVKKLPVIFVCENNGYGISTSQAMHQNITDVSVRAQAYGIPGATVDGNDVLAVHEAAIEAVKRARKGAGPTLLECKTYRWRGHHEGDPSQGLRYRSKEEIEAWKEKCPIKRLAGLIVKRKAATQAALDKIEKSLTEEIDAAVEFAKASPFPALDDMYEDVFVGRVGG